MTPDPPPPQPQAQPAAQPPPPPEAETPEPDNGIAVAGLVVALLSLVLAIIVIGGVTAIIAIVLSIIGLRRSKELGRGRGIAIGGIALSLLALVVSIGSVILITVSLDTEETVRDGIATTSSNTEFPPQDDLDSVNCTASDGGDTALAVVTVTNRSEGQSVYTVTLAWNAGDREVTESVRSEFLEAGDTTMLRLFATASEVQAESCRVTRIERSGFSFFGG